MSREARTDSRSGTQLDRATQCTIRYHRARTRSFMPLLAARCRSRPQELLSFVEPGVTRYERVTRYILQREEEACVYLDIEELCPVTRATQSHRGWGNEYRFSSSFPSYGCLLALSPRARELFDTKDFVRYSTSPALRIGEAINYVLRNKYSSNYRRVIDQVKLIATFHWPREPPTVLDGQLPNAILHSNFVYLSVIYVTKTLDCFFYSPVFLEIREICHRLRNTGMIH